MSCVFGPVPSRRLGRSLGVGPVPYKTCTYDCVYCQLGRTTHQTVQCGDWLRLACRPDPWVATRVRRSVGMTLGPDLLS